MVYVSISQFGKGRRCSRNAYMRERKVPRRAAPNVASSGKLAASPGGGALPEFMMRSAETRPPRLREGIYVA